jgi:hypothetical protein
MPIMKPKSPMRLVRKAFFAASAAVLVEPMADEQVGAHADQFPEDEHHEEVVGQHDAGHREHEQREPAKYRDLPIVFLHVPSENTWTRVPMR